MKLRRGKDLHASRWESEANFRFELKRFLRASLLTGVRLDMLCRRLPTLGIPTVTIVVTGFVAHGMVLIARFNSHVACSCCTT